MAEFLLHVGLLLQWAHIGAGLWVSAEFWLPRGHFVWNHTVGDAQDYWIQWVAAVAQLARNRRAVAAAEQPLEEGYQVFNPLGSFGHWLVGDLEGNAESFFSPNINVGGPELSFPPPEGGAM